MSQVATLIFDSASCDISYNNGCQLIYNNINFRQLLGSMYDKYELFNIELVTVGILSGTFGSSTSDRLLYVTLGGLNFQNGLYNVATKQLIDPIFGLFLFSASTGVTLNTNWNSAVTFRPSETSSITLSLRKYFNLYPVSATPLPNGMYTFIIYPVSERIVKELKIDSFTEGSTEEKAKKIKNKK